MDKKMISETYLPGELLCSTCDEAIIISELPDDTTRLLCPCCGKITTFK
jgi:hypothetical protein